MKANQLGKPFSRFLVWMSAQRLNRRLSLFGFILMLSSQPCYGAERKPKDLNKCNFLLQIDRAGEHPVGSAKSFVNTFLRDIDEIFGNFFANPSNTAPFFKNSKEAVAYLKHTQAKVLDIGCGRGLPVYDLRSRGVDAYGIDGTDALWSWDTYDRVNLRRKLMGRFNKWALKNGYTFEPYEYEEGGGGGQWDEDMEKITKWEAAAKEKGRRKVWQGLKRDDQVTWDDWTAFTKTLPKKMLEKNGLREGNPLYLGDAFAMPYPDETFDVAYSYMSIFNRVLYRNDAAFRKGLKEVFAF